MRTQQALIHGSDLPPGPHAWVPCAAAGPALREAFRKQFEADFDHFLRLRAREFAVNGLLLIIVPGSLGGSHCGEGGMVAMSDAAKELAAGGHIDASLLESLLFPIYLPTEDVRCACTLLTCCMPALSSRQAQREATSGKRHMSLHA